MVFLSRYAEMFILFLAVFLVSSADAKPRLRNLAAEPSAPVRRLVRSTVRNDLSLNELSASGWTRLTRLVRQGNYAAAGALCDEVGVDVEALNADFTTALFSAVVLGDQRMINLLLENGDGLLLTMSSGTRLYYNEDFLEQYHDLLN